MGTKIFKKLHKIGFIACIIGANICIIVAIVFLVKAIINNLMN